MARECDFLRNIVSDIAYDETSGDQQIEILEDFNFEFAKELEFAYDFKYFSLETLKKSPCNIKDAKFDAIIKVFLHLIGKSSDDWFRYCNAATENAAHLLFECDKLLVNLESNKTNLDKKTTTFLSMNSFGVLIHDWPFLKFQVF